MTQYARIQNGIVAEIITTTLPITELFTSDFVATLVESGGTTGVSQGWTYAAGVFAAPVPPVLTLAQRAAALIADGLTITSTSTPALNGVYAVASGVPFGREDIGTEAQFISTFSEFTNGTTTLEWPLVNGTFVTFPSTAAFLNFAKAAGQFYAACQSVMATNSGTLPTASATIA